MPNYTVEKGDTLSAIAACNGINISDMIITNAAGMFDLGQPNYGGFNIHQIYPGDKISWKLKPLSPDSGDDCLQNIDKISTPCGGCACSGDEIAEYECENSISNYTEDLPSPLQVMWYVPENDEILKIHIPDKEIRSWIREAAAYHGIPHSFLAVILQQENGPNATFLQKFLQFGERSLTTFLAIVDEAIEIIPDKASKGSSGFANMSYNTLRSASLYIESNYCKNPMPDSVRYRVLGWDQDTRIPGDDWKADLYYAASHIRELIDREKEILCFSGKLTASDARGVFRRYNGSGPMAEKYADDAKALLEGAVNGEKILFFYER